MSQIVDDLRQVAIEIKTETQVGGNTAARVGGAFERVADALEGTQQIEDMDAAVAAVQKAAQENEQTIQDIVNNLAVVQTTGQSTSSVMSQKAVTDSLDNVQGALDEVAEGMVHKQIIDLTDFSAAHVNSHPQKYWGNQYYGKFLPVNAGEQYVITAGTYATYIIPLKKCTFVVNASYANNIATGYTDRITLLSGNSVTINVPSDCECLYIQTTTQNGDITPSIVKLVTTTELDLTPKGGDKNGVTSDGVFRSMSALSALGQSTLISGFYLYPEMKWGSDNSRSMEAYSISEGDYIHIEANSNQPTYYAFVSALGTIAANNYPTATSARYILNAGDSVDVVAPAGTNYIVIEVGNKAPSVIAKYSSIKNDVAKIEEELTPYITELHSSDNITKNYIYSVDGSIKYDSSAVTWGVTKYFPLAEKKGMTLWFFRVFKYAQDMFTYALYSEAAGTAYVSGSGYTTAREDSLTWESVAIDDLIEQFPSANYIRLTINTSYPQPYFVNPFRNKIESLIEGAEKVSLDDAFGVTWAANKMIDLNGNVANSGEGFVVSTLIPLSKINSYLCVGYAPYSTVYDTRFYALYDGNGDVVSGSVSAPTDSDSYHRLLYIDTTELLSKYPTATHIRFCCHISYYIFVIEKYSPLYEAYLNKKANERPSKGKMDNFTFAEAGGSGVINIVSNSDKDVTEYETLLINFGQVLKIGNYYTCFYFGSKTSGDQNQKIHCAYSSNGTTWTRGIPPEVTAPVAGTNLLFPVSGEAISECCWLRVPDNEYPYRMIGNTWVSNKPRCTMWKSADGYNYTKMGFILDTGYHDTQYSAIVRGEVIKLYLRMDDGTPSNNYKRSIGVAYIDIYGNVLTPAYRLIYDYHYTSGACMLDNTRELLIPTWFANNINSAPKTENCHLETYIVEGDKWEEIDTNINDCLNEDTLWTTVAQGFVTIGFEQYICVTERNTDHATAPDESSIKLVKVTRT